MRETANLEYKQEFTKTFLKTVSAFANYGTGQIVFGVSDDGHPVGLRDPEGMALQIENAINDAIDPVPRFEISIDGQQRTLTLMVHEGASKPFLYKGKAYRRSDSSTVEVDRPELSRLFLRGMNVTFDSMESDQQSLSFEVLGRELADRAGIEQLDGNALISLELEKPNGKFNNAAALLADENQFFGIDIARFGENPNIILSRHSLERCSVLQQLEEAIRVFTEHYVYEEIAGFERLEKESIPREAFREAIANALVHRAWDVDGSINVRMFADRIEVTSPGGLPYGMSEEVYLAGGPSIVRNPILANVFFRLGHIERFGTGIPRIVDAYAPLVVSPSFSIRENSVTVVLPVNGFVEVSTEERRVLDAVPKGESVSRADVEKATGLSKDRAVRMLNVLQEKNLVKRVGSGRKIRYERS